MKPKKLKKNTFNKCNFFSFKKSLELQKTLTMIQENDLKEMKSMVDLGCKFFVKAKM